MKDHWVYVLELWLVTIEVGRIPSKKRLTLSPDLPAKLSESFTQKVLYASDKLPS